MPTQPASGATVYRKFSTRAFATGAPTTLAGTPVISIYKNNSTTESVAGVTLTVDFDGRTGLNQVVIDTSADGAFYTNGAHFELVITTGTVSGTSVVGEVVGEFDLEAAVTVPTTAQIATAVWQDATAGDFTVASSIGKCLYVGNVAPGAAGGHFIAGTNAATTVNFTGTITTATNLTNLPTIPANWITAAGITAGALNGKGDWLTSAAYTTPPTVAAIATAVWTDTTAGDFTVLTSPGKIIFAQLGGAFTTTSSSVFTTAALANAPTGGSAPTVAQIATAVWQDAVAGDFTVASSIGKALYIANIVPGAAGGHFIAGTNAATTVATLTVTGAMTVNGVANVSQTGDSFARIGATGSGLTSLASQASVTTIDDFLDTEIAAILAVTNKLDTTLELDGAVYRFTTNALEQAPVGGGGGGGATTAQIWQDPLSSADFSTPGSIGELLKLNIDATISSRATQSSVNLIATAPGVVGTVTGYAVDQDPATLVLGALQADWLDPGTIGASINRAASYGIDKNTALDDFEFYMEMADGSPGVGLIITATRSLDGGAFAPFANAATEISNGWYSIDLAASDTNGDTAGFMFTAPGAKPNLLSVVFQ